MFLEGLALPTTIFIVIKKFTVQKPMHFCGLEEIGSTQPENYRDL